MEISLQAFNRILSKNYNNKSSQKIFTKVVISNTISSAEILAMINGFNLDKTLCTTRHKLRSRKDYYFRLFQTNKITERNIVGVNSGEMKDILG